MMAAGKQINQTAFHSWTPSPWSHSRRRNRTVKGFSCPSVPAGVCIQDNVLLEVEKVKTTF